MKEIEHTAHGTSEICIYEHSETLIKGSFFGENKPEVGDMINTAFKKGNYEVLNIIENRDANICSGCNKKPENAYFIIDIKLITN